MSETPVDPDDPFGDKAWLAEKRAATLAGAPVDDALKRAFGPPAGAAEPEPEPEPALDIVEETVDLAIRKIEDAIRAEEDVRWRPDENGLPPACPVEPLGHAGLRFYFLGHDRTVQEIGAGEFGQGTIDGLFAGKTAYLYWGWPRRGKGNRVGVAYDVVRKNLIDACARVSARHGPFSRTRQERGRGAWRAPDGRLVLNLGHEVLMGPERRTCGLHDGFVYPSGRRLIGPASERAGPDAGRALIALFGRWAFARPELDPRLLAGWCTLAFMAGAVHWRAHVALIGDKGTGKSSLQGVLQTLLGDWLLKLDDATPAAIYQTLAYDALPVSLDEFENDDAAAQNKVLTLIRISSSGGKIGRGGQDGVPVGYEARSLYLMSAINIPPLKPAELSRVALLVLRKLSASAAPPSFSAEQGQATAAAILSRVVTGWEQWPAVLAAFRGRLGAMGHSGRAQDQFGALLAAAWLASEEGVPLPRELDAWTRGLDPAALTETQSDRENWEVCLEKIYQAQPDPWRSTGMHRTVGALLDAFMNGTGDDKPTIDLTRRRLAEAGLALVNGPDPDGKLTWWLGVPKEHDALRQMLAGTQFAARQGTGGGWDLALRRAPAHVWKPGRFRLSGSRAPGVLIDLAAETADGPVFASALARPNDMGERDREPGEDG
jgi:hypothetical protein